MNLDRQSVRGVAVIHVSGRMTGLDTPGQLKEQVMTALKSGEKHILLNLSQVSFIDSSFIGELVACCLATARHQAVLKIACPVRRVQELLNITRLAQVIETFDNEATAIASFSKPAN